MSLTRRDVARLSLLGLAVLMVVTGVVLSLLGVGESGTIAGENAPLRPVAAVPERVEPQATKDAKAGIEAAVAAPESERPLQPAAETKRSAVIVAKPKPRSAERRPVSRKALPPFPRSLYGAESTAEPASGPPPDVLWLSGVIQGEPKVALLRRGGNRYLVKEGDTLEGSYRVLEISSSSVALERAGRKQQLRVGEY